MKPRHKWVPMIKAEFRRGTRELLIQETMRLLNCTREVVEAQLEKAAEAEVWINDIYQVAVHDHNEGFWHLNIRRRDGGPILRDWRHFQRIKDELIGPHHEGVELYPADERLVDTSNKFSIFVAKDPAFRFPFGWQHRDVNYQSGSLPGTRQRAL